jgi:hypothetical protein
VSVHGRPKVKISLKVIEAPANRLVQCGNTGIGLVGPQESAANAALMHHAVKIILQSKKIESVAVQVVKVIVIHPWPFNLETYCAEDPASLTVDDDPLIYDVSVQAIFGGEVIGVFIESLKETLVELIDVGSNCVFQRRIWPLWGQSIGYHAAVSSDEIESGLLKRGGDVFVGGPCEVTSDYVAWQVRITQDPLEVGYIARKEIEPEEIVFVIGQQDAPSRCGGENLWSHHFLAEIVREKAPGGLSFDERHLLVGPRERVWLELHRLATFSRRFFLKRSPCIAFSTSLIRTGI